MAAPYPPARRFEAKRGGGADIESAGAQRRSLPRGPALVAVAVVAVGDVFCELEFGVQSEAEQPEFLCGFYVVSGGRGWVGAES
jgi:hypothetical protein